MPLMSSETAAPSDAIRAGLSPEPKFRLVDFVMAPFRDVDGRVDREQNARRAAKAEAKKLRGTR